MGGRRLLEAALLHHLAGHHGAAPALRQQPEVGGKQEAETHRSLPNVLQAILKPRLRTEGLFLPEAPVQSVLL